MTRTNLEKLYKKIKEIEYRHVVWALSGPYSGLFLNNQTFSNVSVDMYKITNILRSP